MSSSPPVEPGPRAGTVQGNLPMILAIIAVAGVTIALLFSFGIEWMLKAWETPEYNHGYMIPPVAFYLVWLRARALADPGDQLARRGAWLGFGLVALALVVNILGEMSAVVTISEYAMILVIWGLALAATGYRGMRLLWVPLLYLAFMIPLPNFIETRLTTGLMLLSSEIGVAVIRLAGLTVFLEGNVIDLGTYQLQVAEACSGMRYLFPLMSFGFLCAVLFRGRWWQRTILFVATVPLTILMNSVRIGIIGILVNYFGIEQAEGFIHDFEGWVVFMACVGVLFIIVWIFARMEKRRFLEIFGLDIPDVADLGLLVRNARPTRPVLAATGLLVVVTIASLTVPRQAPVYPERANLASLPLKIGDWSGREEPLEKVYLDVLQVSDYLMAQFSRPTDPAPVGLWIAYYDSQTQGAAVHSPKACLPGGGWQITSLTEHTIEGVGPDGGPLRVNRVEIGLGEQRQLVYYWFAQRGRNLTSEYLVKWYIFQDGLTLNRTDGALVRITTPITDTTDMQAGDARLEAFVRDIDPKLAYYLPGEAARPRAGGAPGLAAASSASR
ncbi:MAG: VPLPA-CTERM-specific exosortase XrtD [Chromatiales bacterium]|nr:VPLPA-CTERM-specific exosortase XrtD [Chromatiales bacterium]